jgi:CopG family nickel-responsive transcriptional regulator
MAKDALVRFGVAMEGSLLREFDALVAERGGTRSEVLRDLVRAEVGRARVRAGANAVASLTLVYDHHVRDLTERLTDFQHALGEKVVSTLHVHLDHDHCLEVIVMRGSSVEIQSASEKLLATRGVKHGGLEMIAVGPPMKGRTAGKRRGGGASPSHGHRHEPHHHEQSRRRRRAMADRA